MISILQFNKIFGILFFCIPIAFVYSQTCDHKLEGRIFDNETGKPIQNANIIIENTKLGSSSDEDGSFLIKDICDLKFKVSITHVSYQTLKFDVDLFHDKEIMFYLFPRVGVEKEEIITGSRPKLTTQIVDTIDSKEILEKASRNLSGILDDLPGVHTLKSGSGIGKPIVDGMYGNRLMILNNGVTQSGQQWGNDHSPEIDPLVASNIKVIKGVGSLEYMGSSLGSIVLVEPGKIEQNPGMHYRSSYFYESNGQGNGLNIQTESFNEDLPWKLNATIKRSGDKETPNYYLNNTGLEELNLALQFEKTIDDEWRWDAYFSSFNSEIGVLRGSHIGNVTDLESALERDEPFFTEDDFSSKIDAPRQDVSHLLFKLNVRQSISENEFYSYVFASQFNRRQEYDVRRGGRTNRPAMSIDQFSNFFEAKYEYTTISTSTKYGAQANIIRNKNDNDLTGIVPLVPDYFSYEMGLYYTFSEAFKTWRYEIGTRYDFMYQDVASISQTLPRRIIDRINRFHNLSFIGGLEYPVAENHRISLNSGLMTRNPGINELYSFGLHQGVSGIEEGDPNLKSEISIKNTIQSNWDMTNRISIYSSAFYQYVNDYIHLVPQNEIKLTIRGAFPLFQYEQVNASLYGFDVKSKFEFSDHFDLNVNYSFIRGEDLTNDEALVNIPSSSIESKLIYHLDENAISNEAEFELSGKYVFKQTHLNSSQDFVDPPDAYFLLNFNSSFVFESEHVMYKLSISVDNLLDELYRDYLNRHRYFADETGRNFIIGLTANF